LCVFAGQKKRTRSVRAEGAPQAQELLGFPAVHPRFYFSRKKASEASPPPNFIPLKNGVGVLEAFFHFFLGLVPRSKNNLLFYSTQTICIETNARACSLISISNFSLNQDLVLSQATHSCDQQVSLTAHCEILLIAGPEVRHEYPHSILERGGRATGLYQKFGLDWVPGTMDPRLSALDQFGGSDPPTAIKKAMTKGPPGDLYLAPDLLLAICHHIAKHDLPTEAVQDLLSQPNATGFPCLSQGDTVAILDGYYQAMAALPRGRGQLSFAHHPGSILAARVTLSRAARSIGPLSRKVYHPVYGDLHKMRVRELRDALELKETAKDIILRRPTHNRRDMPEFRAAWRNDNDVLMRKLTGHFCPP